MTKASPFAAFSRAVRSALLLEMRSKFGATGLGLLLRVSEPVFHISVLVLWHWLIRVTPVYGNSKVLFISSGIFPTFVVIHLSSQFTHIIGRKRWFPGVAPFDVMLVRSAVVLFTYALIGVALFGGMAVFVTPAAAPFQWGPVAAALVCLSIMGFGIGMCNAVVEEFFPPWHFIWGGLARAGIIFSGVLYVPDFLPINLRSVLQWNPILQGVELFRYGFYRQFPHIVFKPTYFLALSIGLFVIGLTLESLTRPLVGRLKIMKL